MTLEKLVLKSSRENFKKQNKTKQKKQNKTSKTKQNKTKQNKTKQNKQTNKQTKNIVKPYTPYTPRHSSTHSSLTRHIVQVSRNKDSESGRQRARYI